MATADLRSSRLVTDDRGAIMVMGIFMCVFLVGALWYIAGVGDALVFRERMQEASDAVAFSTAVLEARGMNILVMLNLLMAAILTLLVAINVVIYVTVAFAILMTAIGTGLAAAVVTAEAAPPFFTAAEISYNAYNNFEKPLHDDLKPLVGDALEALHDAEQDIPTAVPVVAQLASEEIIGDYEPLLSAIDVAGLFIGGETPLAATPLPVKDGTTHKLCMKSFDALKGALGAVTGGIESVVVGPILALANLVGESDLFCELGGNGTAPNLSSQLNSTGSGQCSSNPDITATCQQASADEQTASNLQNTCAGWAPPRPPPDPQCPNLDGIQSNADAEQQTCADKKKRCQDNVDNKSNAAPASSSMPSSQSSDGSGKEPAAVDHSKFWNGTDKAQILAVEYGSGSFVTYSPRFVKFASQGAIRMNDPSAIQRTAVSQAEFFYDAAGTWDSIDGDQDTMWNFRWRARFRLVNPSVFFPVYALEAPTAAQIASDLSRSSLGSFTSPAKDQLVLDIANLLPPMSMTLH